MWRAPITFQAFKLASMKDDPAIAEHWEIMKDYGGPQPTNFSVYAQLLGEVAVEILNRTCDNLTREGVMDAMESIQDWHSHLLLDGVNVNFSKTDHTALQTGRMLRSIVENGKGKWEYFGPMMSSRQSRRLVFPCLLLQPHLGHAGGELRAQNGGCGLVALQVAVEEGGREQPHQFALTVGGQRRGCRR